jgi:2-C-methyl-D-erythritol 2,4-cyclodiphosphate synthase
LGRYYPSSDPALRGIASTRILAQVGDRVGAAGYRVGNVDATLIAQAPRLAPHLEAMEQELARTLQVAVERVNVKVTSTDGLGAIGRGEGIAAEAVVLLVPGSGTRRGE